MSTATGWQLPGPALRKVQTLADSASPTALFTIGALLERFSPMVLVLTAALPAASNVPMLAERFGAGAGRIAQVVLITTVVAFATFPLAVGCSADGRSNRRQAVGFDRYRPKTGGLLPAGARCPSIRA